MWVCPECKIKNGNLADVCSVCGTSPDGTKKASKAQSAKDVGVTRRFSVGTFMIMTSLFGVLFAIMTMLNIHPIAFCCIALFFAGIGVAQMSLFGGNEPRKASCVAGFPLGFICTLGGNIAARWVPGLHSSLDGMIATSIAGAVLGGPCGYVAGCLIAGIFLVRERESDEEDDPRSTFDDEDENDANTADEK
jgi:MFS family permease